MTPGKQDNQRDMDAHMQRIYQKLDKFEERTDQLEGQMTIVTKWLERIEHRLERLEDVRIDLLQAIAKLQTELKLREEKANKERYHHAAIERRQSGQGKSGTDHRRRKSRRQERFLQIWAVLGPVIASVLTSFLPDFSCSRKSWHIII